MLEGDLVALRGILSQQQDRERLPGTQKRALNPFPENIGSKSYPPGEYVPLDPMA